MSDLRQSRHSYSAERLADLSSRISAQASGIDLGSLFIFAAGSFARREASLHSDVDLFFGYESDRPSQCRTQEIRLFGNVIEILNILGFPPPSGDSRFIRTHKLDDVVNNIGSEKDDVDNHFTFRMLMLLESRPVLGDVYYTKALTRIIEAYFEDYPRNQEDFRPWFLLNDISRYWKTLALNYENKKRQSSENVVADRVRNFKLKYSRLVTCFATIAAIARSMPSIQPEDVLEIATLTPYERLRQSAEGSKGAQATVNLLAEEYDWFLEQTGKSTEELQEMFASSEDRKKMFNRADAFGNLVYSHICAVSHELSKRDSRMDLLRYLVA